MSLLFLLFSIAYMRATVDVSTSACGTMQVTNSERSHVGEEEAQRGKAK
jgi:hypothetical protein